MMRLIRIEDSQDPRVADFAQLTDVALRRHLESQRGLFMAESLQTIRRALAAGYVPRSFLILPKWIDDIEPVVRDLDVPVYVGTSEVLQDITGFVMHRGALAAFERPALPAMSTVVDEARLIAIIEDVVDHTNVGAIFRSVAAVGADAVLVSERCADPLYRRSVRVSMGTVFQVPWTRMGRWDVAVRELHAHGFTLVAMALADRSVDIREIAARHPEKVALVLGTEGTGLTDRAIASCDAVATIPMRNGVDSLNVAAAAAVGLWEFARDSL